jgi:hypothetical protein
MRRTLQNFSTGAFESSALGGLLCGSAGLFNCFGLGAFLPPSPPAE